ncbi:endopeptidase La [Candidatus Clostridium stratigraminis]|uniref:Lon protease n=1 Tax=Candidatus Clostridium stratigraminis TaxID=3381661 RepID=A0ABW8T1B9_9CLOT
MRKTTNKNIEKMVLPVINSLLLTGMTQKVKLNRLSEEEIKYLENENSVSIALPLKENHDKNNLKEDDFYDTGVLFKVEKIESHKDIYEITLKVLDRIEIKKLNITSEIIMGDFDNASDDFDLTSSEKENILKELKNVIHETAAYFNDSEPIIKKIDVIDDINKLIGYVSQFARISNEDKYELLRIKSLKDRSLRFLEQLHKNKEGIKLQFELAEKFSEKANKNYRDQVLREQLKAIQEELKDGKGNKKDYREKIIAANMPKEIEEIAYEELNKLESQSSTSSDYNIIRNYLDLLVQLPWKSGKNASINIEKAKQILDRDHYGLEKVKNRILQHLAVMKLNKDKKGSILLLVGPPGTGKTSLGKSIAKALKRKYIRLSLGGIKDEAEIRGHRRTYVGALPGRIIQSIKKAGAKNPIMILDEVDKLMGGYNGDPASALLEVLDPEQNNTFSDHYLDVPYDLSEVFFIATANSLDTIPRPLLDRMEIIQVSSYTSNEKFNIGKNHLIPEILREHGLTSKELIFKDEALHNIIDNYTLEAGVRGLKKQLATIARIASEKVVSKSIKLPYIITEDILEDILGNKVSRHDRVSQQNPTGVVTGLAFTPVGGEILFIEATSMSGNGQVILTGKLGDVMKESARISLSLLKSRLAINSFNFKETDLHIHVPSGAVPKDGPSAGIALFTALTSLITGINVDSKLAMTGEITLRGAVLPIGGLKEKLLGAQRAGIKKVLIPKDNLADLKEVPNEVKNELTIIPVETIEDVMKEALNLNLPKSEYLVPDIIAASHLFK